VPDHSSQKLSQQINFVSCENFDDDCDMDEEESEEAAAASGDINQVELSGGSSLGNLLQSRPKTTS
jgi:hypothetical protein